MIDGDFTLRRTPYDVEGAANLITQSGMPGADAFARDYVLAPPSDLEALETFRAIADKQQAVGSFE